MRCKFSLFNLVILVLTASIAGAEPPVTVAKPAAPPPSSLIITSKTGLFRVETDHADVQTVIKQLFEKGNRQFNLENGITGIVTIRLIEQPLRVILDEICRQTFLQYRFDGKTGIYRFERNEQALRIAIIRLQSLNMLARQQLDLMGIDLNSNTQRSLTIAPLSKSSNSRVTGLGSALTDGTDISRLASEAVPKDAIVKLNTPVIDLNAASSALQNNPKQKISGLYYSTTNTDTTQHNDRHGSSISPNPRAPQQILAESRLVSFRIPNGHPQPVTEVLQQIGKQAQVTISIDTEVPTSLKLRIEGSVSARPLPDLLNILTAYARLEWRWDGDHILITPRPDFRLFVGDGSKPRVDSTQPSKTKGK